MLDQHLLASPVAIEHASDLRHRGMAFIQKHEQVFREKIDQTGGTISRFPARQMQGVIFDPVAESHFLHHLQIVVRAHADALSLQILVVRLERGHPFIELPLDRRHRRIHLALGGHVLVCRIQIELVQLAQRGAGERIKFGDLLNLVTPHLHPQGLLAVSRHDINHIPAHPETASFQVVVVALV